MKLDELEAVVQIFKQAELSEMTVETGEIKLKLAKAAMAEGKPVNAMPAVSVSSDLKTLPEHKKEELKEEGHWITSPLVGTFYQSDIQGGEPLVKVGEAVKKGDLLCIVEAMKMMNEIRCDRDGIILEVAVENGALVEYSQPLFRIGAGHD